MSPNTTGGQEPSDAELIREAIEHPTGGACSVLVQRHDGSVRSAVRLVLSTRGVRDEDVVEDVSQQTWLALFARAGTWEDRGTIRPWLCRVGANKARDELRRLRKWVQLPCGSTEDEDLLDAVPARLEAPPADLEPGALRAALERLQPQDRHLLELRADGLSNPQIASLMGLDSKIVGSRVFRARTRLGRLLRAAGQVCQTSEQKGAANPPRNPC